MENGQSDDADREPSAETRRAFIERLRTAAALPVVVALGLTWTKKSKAGY